MTKTIDCFKPLSSQRFLVRGLNSNSHNSIRFERGYVTSFCHVNHYERPNEGARRERYAYHNRFKNIRAAWTENHCDYHPAGFYTR